MKEIIKTDKAPVALGPYSQAVVCGGEKLLFMSGQIALDPGTMKLVGESASEQCRQVMNNLSAVLRQAGGDLSCVVKTTIFLINMDDFAAVNEVYAEFFQAAPPARATVEVSRLPKDAKIEIDAVAVL